MVRPHVAGSFGLLVGVTGALSSACLGPANPYPACGSGGPERGAVLAGPGESGFDQALATKAAGFDRQFHEVVSKATGVTADLQFSTDPVKRAALTSFVRGEGGAFSMDDVTGWGKAAGLYAGAGIAADLYEYAVLRDAGAACADVDAARARALKGLSKLHLAVELPATPGVIARGYLRKDLPGGVVDEIPLSDGAGNALPIEKNNGTWRADRSGAHPDYAWEDSCSRDMLLGWAFAFGAAWEVVADDPSIPEDHKASLKADAKALGDALRVVRASGYDLEIPDADGRTTFHGYLNENSLDRAYIPGIANGFHALLALAITSTFAKVSGDAALASWVQDVLVGERDLPGLVKRGIGLIFLGSETNGSNVNMAFVAMWLALRNVSDAPSNEVLVQVLKDGLYAPDIDVWKPSELGQSLFDFMAAAYGVSGGAVERGVETLKGFPDAPYFGSTRVNCDESELPSGACILEDGTEVSIPAEGRGDHPIASRPLPMRVRPPSNYRWRSDPYSVNGEASDTSIYSGVDFRLAYWLGRFAIPVP